MNARTLIATITLGALCTLALHAGAASEPGKPAPGEADIAKMLATMSAPAKEHGALDMLTGDWKVESGLFMPNAPALRAAGTGKGQWILGKRFLQFSTTVTSPGGEMTTEALAFYGFDTRTAKYTLVGMDTLGTYYITAEGDFDAATSTFTLRGEEKQGAMTMKFDWSLRREAESRLVSEVRIDLGGQMTKVAEVVLTR